MRRRQAGRIARATLALVAGACVDAAIGPTPVVEGLTPSLVCREQVTSAVTLTGAGLSPLAIDGATGEPRLALPEVSLHRTEDLSGAPVTDPPVVLDDDPATAAVSWSDATTMGLSLAPELGLPPGLFAVTVTNPNGGSATLAAALTTVSRPLLAAVTPASFSRQAAQELTLTGAGFIRIGGELPTIGIGSDALVATALDGCRPLPGPTAAETCTTALVTIAKHGLAEGTYAVRLTNPEPAACASTEEISVEVTNN